MKFNEYIHRTHVFTNQQLVLNCGLAESSVKTMLKRAVEAGQIERVRRGVYVSKVGKFSSTGVDSFELVTSIDDRAVISFHSALEAHGVAHNVGSVCQFRSLLVKSPFEYSGILYVPHPLEAGVFTQSLRAGADVRVVVTTREQTIVDCLGHADHCGGVEEVLRSISLFPYIDVEVLKGLVSSRSASLAARAGWLLEQKADAWRVSPATLDDFEKMAQRGPFRLDKDSAKSRGWSRRWRLCLPEREEEVRGWLV